MKHLKLGSLFDGSGGFPLAGALNGIEPVWASEVEPYPIAVTTSRFPYMKHLGDVSKVNGAEIEPVDIITFGSPCQDMSVAGKRAGIKHDDHGDEETTRSGLFYEAIRIIKEMRYGTEGRSPTFVVWENVPGAFSSNRGEDFRTVLEELVKIAEPTAVVPDVPQGGWAYADCWRGDGWSLAYRIFDSQYIRTAQRRRRVYAVLDLGGQCARQILFERDRLRGNTPSCGETRQGAAADAQGCVGADDRERACYGFPLGFRPENVRLYDEKATDSDHIPCVIKEQHLFENHSQDSRYKGPLDVCPMLPAQLGTGGNNQPFVVEKTPFCKSHRAQSADDATTWKHGEKSNTLNTFDLGETRCNELVVETVALEGNGQRPSHHGDGYIVSDKSYTLNTTEVHGVVYALDRASFNQGENAQYDFEITDSGVNSTIVAKGPSAVAYGIGNGQANQSFSEEVVGALNCMHDQQAVAVPAKPYYIVRRLTPTECARLQGFPDLWGHPDKKTELTDEEYRFWLEVRNTHAAINGKAVKDYTKKQMLTWYNKLHNDGAEYKMWGNGIALPCALYVMEGIVNHSAGLCSAGMCN